MCVKKEKNAVSSTQTAYSEHSIAVHSITVAGYVTANWLLSAANSQPWRRAISVIFDKLPLTIWSDFTTFFSFLTGANLFLCFSFFMCLSITLANLRPNIINFYVVDFSKCRSEEVMFLLTLSVCRAFFFHPRYVCKIYYMPVKLIRLIALHWLLVNGRKLAHHY